MTTSGNDSSRLWRFQKIERLANNDLDSTLVRMIDLLEEPADSYSHEIADSTILWVLNKGTRSTLEYLKKKIEMTNDNYCQKIFQEWISKLQKTD